MKRRIFIKAACVASTTVFSACKNTLATSPFLIQANKLVINKSLFITQSKVTLTYKENTFGVIELSKNNYAASLMNCTHRGCAIAHDEQGYVCPCHGARFDQQGRVKKGPAKQNLVTYITSSDENNVYIHLNG